ncbi:sugar transferase [Crocinitomicaceae bacterium]|jgi:exopolysaccharide biosynthesis polyprenyl glycosylphosphotransferase|nr:sugar transferase [Crocinitomicaceae bacterium]MDG1036574.1 sugar transferase [Crocinitomicaceae bacterium]
MNARLLTFILIAIDWAFSCAGWALFYYFRKTNIENDVFSVNATFYLGILLVPVVWIFIYLLQGTYHNVRRLHRLKVINLTFIGTFFGVVILFFLLLIDDEITRYQQYYKLLFALFTIQFFLVLIPRFLIVSYIVKQIHARKAGFKTLIIGGSDKAVAIYDEIQELPKGIGLDFVGFININGIDKLLEDRIEYLGHIDQVETILQEFQIEEVIIALESKEHDRIKTIISRLAAREVRIRILPDMYDILSGTVEMNNIFGALLLDVNSEVMPVWQRSVKRAIDIVASLVSLLVFTPMFIVLAVLVKTSSSGPVFFLQERIGKNGRPFQIIKFRTMVVNAEASGPQLSSSNDPRITSIGSFMRKTRLDEFPQFYNVLVGDMSLVGPRPERQFYIDQIVKIEPQYLELNQVRPGITSWGQVKYGYAENVDQMLDRMKFDLLYLKNRSLSLDIKIMLYTILIIFRGSGK